MFTQPVRLSMVALVKSCIWSWGSQSATYINLKTSPFLSCFRKNIPELLTLIHSSHQNNLFAHSITRNVHADNFKSSHILSRAVTHFHTHVQYSACFCVIFWLMSSLSYCPSDSMAAVKCVLSNRQWNLFTWICTTEIVLTVLFVASLPYKIIHTV